MPVSHKQTLMITATAALALSSCGPETNSRYGDANWDPITTKQTFDPINAPSFEVVYRDETPDDDTDDNFTALITLDFTEQNRESSSSIIPEYQRGNASPLVIDDWVTSDDAYTTDTHFWNDLESAQDKRLTVSTPGDYSLTMDFDVIWPNGNTVSYLFADMTFTVPGCVDNFTFYSDYINKPLADNCVSCHSNGVAQTAMNLGGGTDTRRGIFLNKVEDGPSQEGYTGTTLEFISSSSHPGASSVGNLPASFSNYMSLLIAKETADSAFDAAANFDFTDADGDDFCFDRPSTLVVEN